MPSLPCEVLPTLGRAKKRTKTVANVVSAANVSVPTHLLIVLMSLLNVSPAMELHVWESPICKWLPVANDGPTCRSWELTK